VRAAITTPVGSPAAFLARFADDGDLLQIPTQAGRLFQLDVGHRSDLKPATIPI